MIEAIKPSNILIKALLPYHSNLVSNLIYHWIGTKSRQKSGQLLFFQLLFYDYGGFPTWGNREYAAVWESELVVFVRKSSTSLFHKHRDNDGILRLILVW